MRVLVVEDDARLARALDERLGALGYAVEIVRDGEEAWFRGDTEDYAAIILDLGLPRLDGLTVLRRWREAKRMMPVLCLTARGSWAERVEGIDTGADDYLAKPFRTEELLARLRALIRRSVGQASSRIAIGDLVLDERQMRVSRGGVPVNLSPLEYRAFAYLARHRGRVVSQIELSEQLYAQDWEKESNAIEALILRLRRKLSAPVIETRRGFGYVVAEG